VLAVLLAVGLGSVAAGGFGLYTEMTQPATAADASTTGPQEAVARWLQLTAGQIFPRTVIYQSTAAGADWPAHLVGIAPRTSCVAATDPQIGPALFSTGFADGRLTHAAAGYPAIQDLGDGVIGVLENILSQAGNPCQEKDVRC
jgi:hypothetical protein